MLTSDPEGWFEVRFYDEITPLVHLELCIKPLKLGMNIEQNQDFLPIYPLIV